MRVIKKYRNVLLRILDICVIIVSYFISEIIINNNLNIQSQMTPIMLNTIILAIIIYSASLHLFRTYKNITRYENGNDYLIYVLACLLSYTILMTIKEIFNLPLLEMRINLIAALIIVTTIIGYRVTIRMILTWNYESKIVDNQKKNVLIIGAGEAAKQVLSTLKTTMKNTYNIIGLVDDNTNKVHYAI